MCLVMSCYGRKEEKVLGVLGVCVSGGGGDVVVFQPPVLSVPPERFFSHQHLEELTSCCCFCKWLVVTSAMLKDSWLWLNAWRSLLTVHRGSCYDQDRIWGHYARPLSFLFGGAFRISREQAQLIRKY